MKIQKKKFLRGGGGVGGGGEGRGSDQGGGEVARFGVGG